MSSSLYPPVIATYMPAFTSSSCRVYFNLSNYQGEVPEYVQVIVNDQKTNASVLDSTTYPLGIKQIEGLQTPEEGTPQFNANQYYITIEDGDLTDGFQNGEYYRVQLRFSSVEVDITSSSDVVAHLDDYSEWSTVCLIKHISEPKVYIGGTLFNGEQPVTSISVDNYFYNISGHIDFPKEDDESLKSVKIVVEVLENNNKTIIETSDTLNINRYDLNNNFNYKLHTKFENNKTYIINISYISRGLYEKTITYLVVVQASESPLLSELVVEPDIDNGCIRIQVKNFELGQDSTQFVILRTDSNSRYQVWEEIHMMEVQPDLVGTFIDKTIEADVWYKYDLQKVTDNNGRSVSLDSPPEPIIIPYDDVFLTVKNKQLKITLNNAISNFKYNTQETKTDTLGSKFPWVRRNAHTYYRSFSLSGTIAYIGNNEIAYFLKPYRELEPEDYVEDPETHEMIQIRTPIYQVDSINKTGMFETRDTLTYKDVYTQYNLDNGIDDTNDVYLERKFREAVMEFLYDTNAKLYRSRTEGNILIKIMNVSFSPKRELGNFIYDFSCEAVEIDDCTFPNYGLYDIQSLGSSIKYPRGEGYTYDYSGKITQVGEL